MRLGAPILRSYSSPDEWVELVQLHGYGAAYCPLEPDAAAGEIESYAAAAEAADIVIAEVGAWSNPLSADPSEADNALQQCIAALSLADRIGARCCVNIAGSTGSMWCGPGADNFSPQTFARIVSTVQSIIDAVEPTHTYFTLEVMPWIPPDSAESYLELVKAIDRERFAVHFDPVNLVTDARKYYSSGEVIRHFLSQLAPLVKGCHFKDILLETGMPPIRFRECRPGTGELDWPVLLNELARVDPDFPILLEHLDTEAEYVEAAQFVRQAAAEQQLLIQ
jgi:sugar phosphate isomerase/epimerase